MKMTIRREFGWRLEKQIRACAPLTGRAKRVNPHHGQRTRSVETLLQFLQLQHILVQ